MFMPTDTPTRRLSNSRLIQLKTPIDLEQFTEESCRRREALNIVERKKLVKNLDEHFREIGREAESLLGCKRAALYLFDQYNKGMHASSTMFTRISDAAGIDWDGTGETNLEKSDSENVQTQYAEGRLVGAGSVLGTAGRGDTWFDRDAAKTITDHNLNAITKLQAKCPVLLNTIISAISVPVYAYNTHECEKIVIGAIIAVNKLKEFEKLGNMHLLDEKVPSSTTRKHRKRKMRKLKAKEKVLIPSLKGKMKGKTGQRMGDLSHLSHLSHLLIKTKRNARKIEKKRIPFTVPDLSSLFFLARRVSRPLTELTHAALACQAEARDIILLKKYLKHLAGKSSYQRHKFARARHEQKKKKAALGNKKGQGDVYCISELYSPIQDQGQEFSAMRSAKGCDVAGVASPALASRLASERVILQSVPRGKEHYFTKPARHHGHHLPHKWKDSTERSLVESLQGSIWPAPATMTLGNQVESSRMLGRGAGAGEEERSRSSAVAVKADAMMGVVDVEVQKNTKKAKENLNADSRVRSPSTIGSKANPLKTSYNVSFGYEGLGTPRRSPRTIKASNQRHPMAQRIKYTRFGMHTTTSPEPALDNRQRQMILHFVGKSHLVKTHMGRTAQIVTREPLVIAHHTVQERGDCANTQTHFDSRNRSIFENADHSFGSIGGRAQHATAVTTTRGNLVQIIPEK